MAQWRPHSFVSVDPSAPRAAGVCDRCGSWYQLNQLKKQYQWFGTALSWTGFLVCCRCLDVPTIQRKAIVVPADPIPVLNPRVEHFYLDEEGPPATNWDTTGGVWDDLNSGNVWDES